MQGGHYGREVGSTKRAQKHTSNERVACRVNPVRVVYLLTSSQDGAFCLNFLHEKLMLIVLIISISADRGTMCYMTHLSRKKL